MAEKKTASLATMLGTAEQIEIKGKQYYVKPITLNDVDEFVSAGISITTQIPNLWDKKSKEKLEKWLKKYCLGESGEEVTLQKAAEDGWDVKDLKNFIQKLCDFSG